MRFWDIVMTAATQGGGAAPGPAELFPQGALADPSQWTLANGLGIAVVGGKMVFTATSGVAIMSLTGSMLATLNAALSNSTPYTVTVVVSGWVALSTSFKLKTGTNAALNITGNGTFQATVTSGVGTLCTFQANNGATFNIDSISVKA